MRRHPGVGNRGQRRIVDRYAITTDNIDPNDDSGSEVDDLTEAYIDITAGQFVVRLVLNGRGCSALLTGQPALVGEIDYALTSASSAPSRRWRQSRRLRNDLQPIPRSLAKRREPR